MVKAIESHLEELLDLDEKIVTLNSIYLDPNNPRFALFREEIIPDSRITVKSIQAKCLEMINEIGIKELKDSIKKVGFLHIDRIVVRPLENQKYVVVEGNRRCASLKEIKKEYDAGEIILSKDKLNSIIKFEVLIYKGEEKDISWTVQGIRHISGIKNWPPYQQAKFLVKLVEEKGMKISDVASILGTGPRKASRMIRSYHGYLQAEENDEYGPYIHPNKFSFFNEAIFQKRVLMDWLAWDESKKRFENEDNFNRFLSLISPGDIENEPKISRAIDIRDYLINIINYGDILARLEDEEDFSLSEAYRDIIRREYEAKNKEEEEKKEKELLKIKMKEIIEMSEKVLNLPTAKIKAKQKKTFIEALERLKGNIEEQLELLR